ncbi:MAG: hypothetical protein CMJ40_10540 [Phycisphaerae bacterium]|nr:hypothetical protein [Phycisphaerae bacterium]
MSSAGANSSNEQIIDLSLPRHWNAVKSPLRMGMLEIITASGGVTVRGLAEVLEIKPSLAHYHIDVLVRSGIIKPTQVAGESARTFSTVGRRLVVVYDEDSRTQAGRMRELVGRRIEHSSRMIQSRLREPSVKSLAHWESLTAVEHKEILKHFDQVDRILARARRRRRRQGLDAQRASSHVLFVVETIDRPMPPTPRVDLRNRS